MREIKFRGKSTSTKWLYGNLLTYTVNGVLWAKIWENDEDGKLGGKRSYTVEPRTVGQYTGLRDKNGVEIYEGDIVDTMALGMFEVIFDCGAFRIAHGCIKFTMIEGSYYEVVGNVHDSPELLKK